MAGVDIRHTGVDADDYVEFVAAGEAAVGEYRCSECGYGIVCRTSLPTCPMCHGASWEETAWRPFTRREERR